MNHLLLQLLVVDDDPRILDALQYCLQDAPWQVTTLPHVGEAERFLQTNATDAVIASLHLPGAMAVLQRATRLHPDSARIALAERDQQSLAEQAINHGEVFRFFTKPWSLQDMSATFAQIRERVELRNEVARLLEVTQGQNEALRTWTDLLELRVEERTLELRESEAKLAQSEKMAAIGKLAGGIAHEINNPLGAILVFTRTARRDLPPGHPSVQDLAEIDRAARQAKKIVESLLTFSRRSAPEESSPTDLTALVHQSEPLLKAICKAGLTVSADPTPPFMGNANRLQQVLVNLVSNADQAMQGGGTVGIRVYAQHGYLYLEVSDQGAGINEAILPHIFEPFFSTKPQGKGTGLGLSIAYGIIREHDGEINVQNRPSGGTCFQVRLPALSHQRVAS